MKNVGTNLDTLALWQTNPRLLTPNDKDVALTSSELVVDGVLDMYNVEATVVTLTMRDNAHTTHVSSTGDHGNDTSVEADEVCDLSRSQVNLDRVVDTNGWIRIANAAIVSDFTRT